MIHSSHSVVDVSDLSLTIDLLCEHCDLRDEELERPCPRRKTTPDYRTPNQRD